MSSQEANTMEGGVQLREPSLPIRQWLLVLTGILVIAVPWWLGIVWMVRELS